jgi:hypothetical protein
LVVVEEEVKDEEEEEAEEPESSDGLLPLASSSTLIGTFSRHLGLASSASHGGGRRWLWVGLVAGGLATAVGVVILRCRSDSAATSTVASSPSAE